jgi:methanogenic corrinoid protein MtbC1
MIGGGLLNQEICDYVGADYWATSAMDGVRLCQRLFGSQSTVLPD